MRAKVYDCFSFFNENLILELRIKTLWEFVDYFVISESNRDHSGRSKPSFFDEERFRKYQSKIRRVVLDAESSDLSGWSLENKQRDHIIHGLYDANPIDLIMVSDCDEIPNPEQICTYNPRFLRGDFCQRYFSYAFNNELYLPKNEIDWYGTKITTTSNFYDFFQGSATTVRSYKSKGALRSIRRSLFKFFRTQKIKSGGWHFTWIFELDGIYKKIKASAHREHLDKAGLSPSVVSELIKNGRDLQVPSRRYRVAQVDESFPQELVNNLNNYSKFLF